MKVLTIQEPYATFIMQGMKKIETRSWQTKYRGLIYIHAGKSKKLLKEITNPDILNLLKNINLNYGLIICKANLIDCVPMTSKFISKIKNQNNNEYLLGKYNNLNSAFLLFLFILDFDEYYHDINILIYFPFLQVTFGFVSL